jgi:hypothetical protein
MAGAWRNARVFIASTFRDIHAERNHDVKVTSPGPHARIVIRILHSTNSIKVYNMYL